MDNDENYWPFFITTSLWFLINVSLWALLSPAVVPLYEWVLLFITFSSGYAFLFIGLSLLRSDLHEMMVIKK